MHNKFFIFCLAVLMITNCAVVAAPQVSLVTDETRSKPVMHGLFKLEEVLKAKKIPFEKITDVKKANGAVIIIAAIGNSKNINALKPANQTLPQTAEALAIWKTSYQNNPALVINGYDESGLMYGLLDVADRISWNANKKDILAEVQQISEQPAVAERAVSVYTMNRRYWESRFYNEDYWKRYFDMLAASRFNMFTIIFGYENGGFLAPCYPYFFNVDGFPAVTMNGLSAQQQQKNLAALNRLVQLAHERGIGITLGIWDHIYRGGIQAGDMGDGANAAKMNGIVSGLDADNLIPYTTAALNKLIELAPGIDAIQFRMHDESGLKKGEQRPFWNGLFQSIAKNHPNMHLVLRAKGLPDETIQDAISSGVKFSIATKFWMEQTGLPYSPTHVYKQDQKNRRHGYADMLRYPQQYKMYWRLWTGGTNRILTWGSPEYASRFVRSLDIYGDGSYGFEVNEMLATKMEAQPHDEPPFDLLNAPYRYYDYEFERYWDFYLSYGRMGYNPQTPADVWASAYNRHFGDKAGPLMEVAVHTASEVLPRIVASCYNYSFFPTTRGWAEKQRIGDLNEYARSQGSDVQQFANFDEEAQLLLHGGETAKILPSTNSVWLKQIADSINNLIAIAEKAAGTKNNKEFFATITDLKILSSLALYYSRRIPAAVYYCIYKHTNNPAALDSAIVHEQNAINTWQQIVTAAGDMYAPDLKFGPAHTGFEGIKFEQSGHWKDELALLKNDYQNLQKELDSVKNTGNVSAVPAFPVPEKGSNAGYFLAEHNRIEAAPAGKPITVRIKITAPAGVKWVRLQYRAVNQYLDFAMLPMQPTNEKDVYKATIPADKIYSNFNLMYLIEMMDNEGHGFIYPDLNKETPYVVTQLVR